MSERRIGFLLGAGVSIPCNAPSTQTLTEEILQPTIPYYRHTDGRYYPSQNRVAAAQPSGVPSLAEIHGFLRDLHARVASYYDNREHPAGCTVRSVNYEDLAYLAVQAAEGINRERDNPALVPFIEELARSFGTHDALQKLADETIGLIVDHVAHRLQGLTPNAGHLACIRDACRANKGPAIPILSLNNDCLIESMLGGENIALNDMTSLQRDGRRIVTVAPSASGVNLYKLHGSIDWFRWQPENGGKNGFWGEWVGYKPPAQHCSSWIAEDRPVILVGRFNKELSYASSPFAELFGAARASLNDTTQLVVSGYSFGDKAVNTMLVDWLYAARKGARRLIVAHNDVTGLRNGARGAISKNWIAWVEAGVLIEIPAFLGDLSWPELHEWTVKEPRRAAAYPPSRML